MFDRTSGLVYNEIVLPERRQGDRHFMLRCLGAQPKPVEGQQGPSTLQSIAMRSVLSNLDDMDHDALGYLPPMMIKKIWDVVKRR